MVRGPRVRSSWPARGIINDQHIEKLEQIRKLLEELVASSNTVRCTAGNNSSPTSTVVLNPYQIQKLEHVKKRLEASVARINMVRQQDEADKAEDELVAQQEQEQQPQPQQQHTEPHLAQAWTEYLDCRTRLQAETTPSQHLLAAEHEKLAAHLVGLAAARDGTMAHHRFHAARRAQLFARRLLRQLPDQEDQAREHLDGLVEHQMTVVARGAAGNRAALPVRRGPFSATTGEWAYYCAMLGIAGVCISVGLLLLLEVMGWGTVAGSRKW